MENKMRILQSCCFVALVFSSVLLAAPVGDIFSAAEKGDMAAIKKALSDKKIVTARNIDRETLLHRVVVNNDSPEIVKLLVADGAEIDARDYMDVTPLMNACANCRTQSVKTLLSLGAKINAVNQRGFTPLIYAAANGCPDIVKILISLKADVSAKQEDGYTALYYAEVHNRTEVIRLLKSAGAK
jgi:ankyrin repeat protein